MLQWLLDKGKKLNRLPWNKCNPKYAIWKWALSNGYNCFGLPIVDPENLLLLKLFEKYQIKIDISVITNAAKCGHLHIIKWFKENGYTLPVSAMEAAVGNGDLEMVIYLRENGCNWNMATGEFA